jgi:hypothetical protein
MGAQQSRQKVKCLILPAQSGKTRKVEELIAAFKEDELTLDVVISANNKLLNAQTVKRMATDLCTADSDPEEDATANAVIKGNVFSWTSGNKKTNISARELKDYIIEDIVEMVVICANGIRMRYLADGSTSLIGLLAASRHFNRKINVWIDEADATIRLWSKYEALLDLPCINQVTLFSATFDTVFSVYKRLTVIPYNVTHPACYRRLADCVRHEEDIAAAGPVDYVARVLAKHSVKLVRPGMRAFIPGNYTKRSHEDIADLLRANGFAVMIMNGARKELIMPTGETIDLRPYLTISDPDDIPEEFNQTLAAIYKDSGLAAYPFAITGFICVERGVTFQTGPLPGRHDGFLFDYAIIPPIDDKAEAYQAMARVFGNVGDIPGWRPCEIYTNSATFSRVQKQEDVAVHLARIVHEEGLVEVGQEHVRQAANSSCDGEWDLFVSEFSTHEEAVEHYRAHTGTRPRALERSAAQPDFFMSSTTGTKRILSYDDFKTESRGWVKTSNFDIDRANPYARSTYARLYTCYRDMSDPDSVVFVVRMIRLRVRRIVRRMATESASGGAAAAGGAGMAPADPSSD